MTHWTKHWEFHTRNISVYFETTPEDMDPADSFEFDEDVEAVRNGDVEWFCARVRITTAQGLELASDYLGGCAYKSVDEFINGHRDADPMNRNCSIMRAARGENVVICHYFPGMIAEAAKEARKALRRLHTIPVRS